MRDIAITLLIFGALPLVFWRPYYGILLWSWISYMNPHRLTWGFAYYLPFAQIVALTLLAALLLNPQKMRLPQNATIWLWIMFIGWMGLTTLQAIYPEWAMNQYTTVLKIQITTFLTLMLINTRERVQQLLWVIVVSIGFYSVKGGIFTLLTGGAFHVYGPADSNIEENNALALATLMVVPIMVYLYRVYESTKWIKYSFAVAIGASIVSAVGSQSRGALLAILAVGFFYWWKSKSKMLSGMAIVVLGALIFTFMPADWHERMATIQDYEQDESAMSRIYAWKYAINIANDRVFGGGFNSWSKATYAVYSPEGDTGFVAHSIYFSVLADHGWIGLAMFLGILLMTWRRLSALIARGNPPDDPFQPGTLAAMLQVSMVAYLSGGAFLSLSYFDLPWHIICIAVVVSVLYSDSERTAGRAAAAPGTSFDRA